MSARPPDQDSETAALRALYRSLQGSGDAACPPAESLVLLVVGEAAGEDRARLADHVAGCRRCTEDYATLLETHAAASRDLAIPRDFARGSRRLLAAIAAVALLGLSGILLLSRRQAPESAVRSLAAAESGALVTPRAGAALKEAPAVFSWPARKDARGYRVRLFDAGGNRLWESPVSAAPQAALPDDVRRQLSSGSFFWTVEFESRVGRERLGPFPFSLAPR